ncbi:MAG: GIY-YIG nuclease family protein [Gracilimonas sp.]
MNNATYILTNPQRTVLYTGVTNNLPKRLVEHYQERGNPKTFAGKYYCYCLIWYDVFPTMHEAIEAEKRIKGKKRAWKEKLIENENPVWKFLNDTVIGEWPPRGTIPEKGR